ncbi:hypothetical protein [Aquibium oceanicum]|uniref:Uncharacterized protein n=1 Tax=Aquibium oceanicum TaxID=1670800 RepID=A0A1L3SKV2_9HYPH|nr:hypothetical protein [Aquibium oceanicum]APH70037.1 hypothetical protein BSQ44_00560 [Aquibium oceanicum]
MANLIRLDYIDEVLSGLVPAECLAFHGFSNFLADWSILKGRKSFQLENPVLEASEEAKAQCLKDVETLSATDLKMRFPAEYNSHKNRKFTAKKNGWLWHPEFADFASFLRIVGPIPEPGCTLDRIDPHDTEYAPGKVRWLGKRGQANNRKCTIMKTYEDVTAPLSVWAEETKQPYDRLYARHTDGWTDEQVIFGKDGRNGYDIGAAFRPWNQHWDEAEREKAEDFFRKYMRPAETPLEFCIRYFRMGTRPWEEFLENHVGSHAEEEAYSGIAPHCVPAIENAARMLQRLRPLEIWIERASDTLKAARLKHLKGPESSSRSSQPASGKRRVDYEVAHQNYCENYPELGCRDEYDDEYI